MTDYMAQVFSSVCSKEFQSPEEFLAFFKAEGCYLDDVSHTSVNHLDREERIQRVGAGVEALAQRIKEYKPTHIIAVLKSIAEHVRRAAQLANHSGSIYSVPFPGHGNQSRFVTELSAILSAIYAK